ncbi:hypothetical protein KP509_04G019200 [Ceratopteris richardii]|uniref:Ubiquitin-related modifier 1 homolog n=1 Tax=Ceratopteris richardii TaxID=49495 RepID=A0A8T2UQU9_CERRI|nr:hypothetical protein KP509_04G019200 [Ceratopteris richardii]
MGTDSVESNDTVHLNLEFGGGLEILFGSIKCHSVDIPLNSGSEKLKMEHLLVWVRDNLLQERPEFFMKEKSVRPGVLVLINDCDWELCERLNATLENNDTVVFISTLHGG